MISVVITVYKNSERIPRALETVKNQIYNNLEILVVDGANSKENKKIVNKFRKDDKRIKYVSVEPEAVDYPGAKGVQHARNVGCKLAKGKFIAMLDDDDEWTNDKLQRQIILFYLYPDDCALVTCFTRIYTEDGYFVDKTKREIKYKDLLQNFNLSSTSSYLLRKDKLEEVGWWDEDVRGMHEYDIALKLSKKGYRIFAISDDLMIRNRNYDEQLGSIYWKISEQFEFWNRYGEDVVKYLGLLGTFKRGLITVGLIGIYCLGYVFQNRIWKVIYPVKSFYEEDL